MRAVLRLCLFLVYLAYLFHVSERYEGITIAVSAKEFYIFRGMAVWFFVLFVLSIGDKRGQSSG